MSRATDTTTIDTDTESDSESETITEADVIAAIDILAATGKSYIKGKDIADVLDTYTREFSWRFGDLDAADVLDKWGTRGSRGACRWQIVGVPGRKYDYSASRCLEGDD